MQLIEKRIKPLIKNQFPEFYRDEGELFIAFVEAYYEWMEKNLQELVFEDPTGFSVGDTVTQGGVTASIIANYGIYYLVEIGDFSSFESNTRQKCTSSGGGSSYIEVTRRFNSSYFSRHLPELRDIDSTIESFILQFKNKYLSNIQFTTASNKELFIKNSLDFYRAKGTERAVDLFFKLIYGFEAKVYYPGDDLFRPSDNTWVDVKYLEVEPSDENVNMVGQVVYGSESAAFGYAERLVRFKKGSRYMNVLFISNVNGTFQTNEQVYTKDLDTNVTAKIIGSLTSFTINVSSPGFTVGEQLYVSDGQGKKGVARVDSLESFTGAVNFTLLDGGWGYSPEASIIGSEKILELSATSFTNADFYGLAFPAKQFEQINQDLYQIELETLPFSSNTTLYGYDVANTLVFSGEIVNSEESTNTVIVNYSSNTYSNTTAIEALDTIYDSGNTLSANVANVISVSASANVMAVGNSATFQYSLTSGDAIDPDANALNRGDKVYQEATINGVLREVANGVVANTRVADTNYIVDVNHDTGYFRDNLSFKRRSDGTEYDIDAASNTRIGIFSRTNDFYNGGSVYTSDTETSGTLTTTYSYATQASFTVSSYENVRTVEDFYSDDLISTANLNQIINSAAYGLPDNPSAGFTDIISTATGFANVDLGSIKVIVTTNPGEGYPVDPFYIIYDPTTYHLERYDYEINYVEDEQSYEIGEVIEGSTSNARAVVISNDTVTNTLRATRIDHDKNLVSGELITGQSTNITSTIDTVYEMRRKPRTGLNATIDAQAFTGTGFAASLSVVSSGFGYFNNEILTLVSREDSSRTISTISSLGEQGIGVGYHTNRRSFLSSDKYLHDSDYYQEYSYEVLTALPFEKYKKTLIDVLHVSGTKPFGSYLGTSTAEVPINVKSDFNSFEIRTDSLFVNQSTFFTHEIGPPDFALNLTSESTLNLTE